MWDVLGPIALQGGGWGLVGLAVLSVWRGWLIPRWWYEKQMAAMEKRIADKDAIGQIWKEIAEERRDQIAALMGHVKDPAP